MSVLASLIAALERAGGERLVLRSGETPHVLAGGTRHDLGTTKVSVKALEALTDQILSPDAKREFAENNVVVEPLSDDVSPIPLVVGTHRSGDQIRLELRRLRPAAQAIAAAAGVAVLAAAQPQPLPVPPPPPVDDALILPPPLIDMPPNADEPDWEPIEAPAAAAENPSPDASAQPEVAVAASAGATEVVAVPEAGVESSAIPPSIPEAPEALRPETEATPPEREPVSDAAAVTAPIPAAAQPIEIAASAEPEEESTTVADGASSEAEEIAVTSGAMKVVPITSAMSKTGPSAGDDLRVAADSKGRSDATALEYWIRQAARHDATALYLRVGHAPLVRARQKVQPLTDEALGGPVIDAVMAALAAGEDKWQAVCPGQWAHELDGVGSVMCQAFTDDHGMGLVVHLPSQASASSLQKDIPRQVRRACEEDDGVIVVSAPTVPEVMEMVAAVAEWTAQRRAGYLISIEPPNGLGHNITGVLVSARRIAGTEKDVAEAIRRATGEEPDVLVIAGGSGLIAEEAIRAARPGRLVIVGALAPTAARALDSLLNGVNPEHELQLRRSLAASFRCGFSHRALRGVDGGRAVVHDLVIGTPGVRARLDVWDIAAVEQLQRSGAGGMRSLDAALAGGVHRGEISLRRAGGLAIDRAELVRLVRQAARERRRAVPERPKEHSSGPIRAVAAAASA
jgi:twitching motility protein PilT